MELGRRVSCSGNHCERILKENGLAPVTITVWTGPMCRSAVLDDPQKNVEFGPQCDTEVEGAARTSAICMLSRCMV